MAKKLKKLDGETKLERVVRLWLNDKGRDYDNGWQGAYKDLMYGGCSSGIVSELIYYSDTVKFYQRHKVEINERLYQQMQSGGGDYNPYTVFGGERGQWDVEDPLALGDNNQNLLAWFGFEDAASVIEARTPDAK